MESAPSLLKNALYKIITEISLNDRHKTIYIDYIIPI
jgi:hypothetical protein